MKMPNYASNTVSTAYWCRTTAVVPPKPGAGRKASPPGIPAKVRQAREARGLTWYALAKLAGIPNQATIRDIEQGKDVKLSNLQSVLDALGLRLALEARAV